jgi:hypothetical protein
MSPYFEGLVNDKALVKLVEYDTRCLWCQGRLIGVASHEQVPISCSKRCTKKAHAARRTCRELGQYATEGAAEVAYRAARASGHRDRIAPWACRVCRSWHIRRHPSPGLDMPIPDDEQREVQCRRCGQPFWSWNRLESQMCTVVCLLKDKHLDRYNGCWRKKPWPSQASAVQAAWRLGVNLGDHGTAPYHCEHCGWWHTGHSRRLRVPASVP